MGKIFEAMEKSSREQKIKTQKRAPIFSFNKKAEISDNQGEDINQSPDVEKLAVKEKQPLQEVEKENRQSLHAMELNKSIIAYFKPHSQEAEQFRLLKTSILFPEKGEPPRTIMVTSSAPGEGKSFVAANLAVSMALSIDEYVLLMDCDLRKPSIHKLFGFPDNTPGLSEYLSTQTPLAGILQKTQIDKLTILPCGAPPSNPYELVSSDQMRRLIQETKSRYSDRYIIIDSPPPYITAEANALARLVDAIIIVVKTGRTKKSSLQELVDTYGKNKILGVVKNYDEPLPFSKKTKYNYVYNRA